MSPNRLETLAAQVGAADIFVFHLLSDDRMVNLDGWGRGLGWAGNVCLDPDTEQFLGGILDGGVARAGPGSPERIFGPYWAEEAVAVRQDGHVIAIGGRGVAGLSDETVLETAVRAIAEVSEVQASKRLADNLEIAQAELSVARIRGESLEEVAEHLARAAARALSCEFGAVLLAGNEITVACADEGWRPAATSDEVATALIPLLAATADGLLVEQDLRDSPYAVSPLGFGEGLVARCSAPFSVGGTRGLIVVAHSGSAPRGFTDLCQRVAATMASASDHPLSAHI